MEESTQLIDMSKVIKIIIDYWFSPSENFELVHKWQHWMGWIKWLLLVLYFLWKTRQLLCVQTRNLCGTVSTFEVNNVTLASFIVQFEFRNCWRCYIMSQQIETYHIYVENNSNIALGKTYIIRMKASTSLQYSISFESIKKKESRTHL